MKMKHSNKVSIGCSKRSSKREVYSNTIYLRRQEKSQINNRKLKELLEKEGKKTKLRVSGRKEIINLRIEINEIETKKKKNNPTEKTNETKSLFFEKIDKIDKPFARFIRKKGELPNQQISEMKKEKL